MRSPHPNETFWRLQDGCLCLLNAAREITTIFTESAAMPDGKRVLRGVFRLTGGTVHVLRETGRLDGKSHGPAPRVAVLIRTHLNNAKLQDLAERLSAGRSYDVYICADCTREEIVFDNIPVLRHRLVDAERLELPTEHPKLFWNCGDYPLYFAAEQIPDYDYYMMIEYDVHILGYAPAFIEELTWELGFGGQAPVDFAGTRSFKGRLDEHWGRTLQGRYPEVYMAFFPFIVVSRAAVTFLLGERRAERKRPGESGVIMFCEAFVPSALKAHGFRVVDLTALIPGAVNDDTFRVPSDSGPMLLWQRIYLDPAVRMVHPVYDEDQFLRYFFTAASWEKSTAKLAQLAGHSLSGKGRRRLVAYARRLEAALAAGGDVWVAEEGDGQADDEPGQDDPGGWGEALRRGQRAVWELPDQPHGYGAIGEALRGALALEDSEQHLLRALRLFPGDMMLETHLALTLSSRRDWARAFPLWQSLKARYPDDGWIANGISDAIRRVDEERAFAPEDGGGRFAVPPDLRPPASAGNAITAALLTRFESLGENCEFGLVQMKFGAEPLGLLRWAGIAPDSLLAALEAGFEGFGEPGQTKVRVVDGEYHLHVARYAVSMNSFVPAISTPIDEFADKQMKRFRFLRRKLLDDLRAGQKLFVYKSNPRLSPERLAALYGGLKAYNAANRLLYVSLADAEHPVGTLECLEKGLFAGYIERFETVDIDLDSWVRLCQLMADAADGSG